MNEQAVKALSENEIESAIILERMKAQATDLTSRQAAEVVKNSKEATDGAIEEAERQYDETIAWIVRQRDETGTISAEEADELIRQAERQRDESIKSAEECHEGIIKQAQLQAEEHINLIDWETGEILTKWEVFKNNLADKLAEIERNVGDTFQNVMQTILEKMGMSEKGALEHAEAMRLGAGEACRILTGQTDMSFTEIYNLVKDRMTEAREIVDDRLEEIKKYFAELKLKFPEISMEFIEKAKEKAKGIADDIKGFFNNMSLKIPTPSFKGGKVTWNAKGAIFNKPTIFDTPAGLQGVGEKGSEVVMPLYGKEMKPFADAITSGLMTNLKELNRQYDYETTAVQPDETNYNYHINLNVD